MKRIGLLALALLTLPLTAQSPAQLLEDARQAYLVLELDRARDLAARSLAARGPDALPEAGQADALMLLGTIDALQERPREAERHFTRLILLRPTYVPDSLTTPSAPLQLFRRVREATKAVVVEAPGPQLGVGAERPFRLRVIVSSLHDVRVSVLASDADTVDVVWSGPIGDATTLEWVPPTGLAGRHALVAASIVDGTTAREVRIPLVITPLTADTLSWPTPPTLVPEMTGRTPAVWQPLALGTGLGVAALLAPVVAGGESGSRARWLVAGGLTVGGVIGMLRSRRPARDPEVAAANAAARAAWERERERISAANVATRAGTRVNITTGAPTRREIDRP